MQHWQRLIQQLIGEMDDCIRNGMDARLSLSHLAHRAGYGESHFSRMFRRVSGMGFREYWGLRRLAFGAKALQEEQRSILEIALNLGFSSHEAFTRAFRRAYGITPRDYRAHPVPLALRAILRPFDCYLMQQGDWPKEGRETMVKTYFITIPAHQFLHIRNLESIGYWDFWQKQGLIPGQDCETICGLLDSIPGKLDDLGGGGADSGSGQLMAFQNDPAGRICSWGIPLAECYGCRLPLDWQGEKPGQMQLITVPQSEYIVFEHGPFDFEKENALVEARIEEAMKAFDYDASGYELDTAPGRIFYFYHDCNRYWKYVRPVRRKEA